jgi:hypothetical protein
MGLLTPSFTGWAIRADRGTEQAQKDRFEVMGTQDNPGI